MVFAGKKPKGFEFWKNTLKGAKYVVAPMVDQSELAWRVISRRYGAELCYTPMINSKIFVDDRYEKYRKIVFTTLDVGDSPLIAQFCGNDPETLLKAAKFIQDKVVAVDLNLGCPQGIAKKGFYGSFLQDEWELIEKIVKTLDAGLDVPVTCKIRIFPDEEKTLKYAKMLESAGCQLLTVHGRTREQRAQSTGLADWKIIKKIKESLSIPVFANGNILYHEDFEKCLRETGADGVMTAEGNLCNPAICQPVPQFNFDMALEYLEICRTIETPSSQIRAHLFKIFNPCLPKFPDHRAKLATVHTLDEFMEVALDLKSLLLEEMSKEADDEIRSGTKYQMHPEFPEIRVLPIWICQPLIREVAAAEKAKAKAKSLSKDVSLNQESSSSEHLQKKLKLAQ